MSPGQNTRAALLRGAAARLAEAGVPEPGRDARRLLRWASGLAPADFATALGEPPGPAEAERFRAAVEARAARRPVSQITGLRRFWGREFRVTPEVLDPRPETEALVAAALEEPFSRVLDLGTGSGCILLTLLAERQEATGLGTDAGAAALAVARENAERLGLGARAEFREADWLDGVAGRFDLVVSNPPYVAEAEMAALAPEVRLHEPRAALTPGGDGLDAYRRIAAGLPRVLAPGARVLLETGPAQGPAVARLLARAGLLPGPIRADLDGRPRVVTAREPGFFAAGP
jgi:release factor glutamine methyltransferase